MKTMLDNNSLLSKRDLRILFPIEPQKGIWLQWLGLMLLSSILKREGFEVEAVKADMQEIRKKLKDGKPTLLGYSVPTYLAKFYIEFNKLVKKEFDVFAIFGGPHPTFFPEMIDSDGVDAICVGEGENALLELAVKLDEGKSIHNINNLWIKENGQIHKNSLGPLVHNLDEIPFADRSLLYPYQPKSRLSPTGLMASRGCPYRCTYCFNKAFRKLYKDNKKSHYRRRSVANFIEELQILKDQNPATYFIFWDDIFTMSKSWLEEFIGEYKTKINIPFNCNVRANLVNKDIARLLKEGGCNLASLGLEAANDHLRDEVLKRNMNKKQIIDAIGFLKNEGIKVHTFNLIGIPKGTIDNDLETLELNIRTDVDYPMCFILHPYHRTELYDIALKEGLIQKEFQELGGVNNPYGYHPPLKRDAKERAEIENLHRIFSFLVKIKASPSLARKFIRLPLGKLYSLIYSVDFSYARYVRQPPAKLTRLMIALKQGSSPPDQQVGEGESQLIGN